MTIQPLKVRDSIVLFLMNSPFICYTLCYWFVLICVSCISLGLGDKLKHVCSGIEWNRIEDHARLEPDDIPYLVLEQLSYSHPVLSVHHIEN